MDTSRPYSPQSQLRLLADKLESTNNPEYVHDIQLARVLADALDKLDKATEPVYMTANNLINSMRLKDIRSQKEV